MDINMRFGMEVDVDDDYEAKVALMAMDVDETDFESEHLAREARERKKNFYSPCRSSSITPVTSLSSNSLPC